MPRLLSLLLVLIFSSCVSAQSSTTTTVALNGHTFTLPAGYTIQLAAKLPEIDRPISAAFDDRGRLYVTVSSGSNERGPEQAKKRSHRIVRLEDSDQDGVFDKAVLYADQIAMPQGAMWYHGSFYVAAPPQILKFTDSDDDGKADRREIWFDGKTITGCMNDLHGPWLGPDGWIYWTKGAFAPQAYTIHGKEWNTRASHLFRARPDGSGLEPLMTGGMDNPVGLAFTPTGSRIVSGTFFQFPGDGKRDGLIHAIYGGIFGKDWDVIREAPHRWTRPDVLPIMTHLGPAAPCGMTRFESAQLGQEMKDNLFLCLFNLRKVTRHELLPDGATYKTRDHDFVVSDQPDFHPTDVIEAPDGSLLIVDTGGWYKVCCPTSQLVQPDALGAIYRVRKLDATKLQDPLGLSIDWKHEPVEKICRLLDDPRTFVKRRAIESLSRLDAQKELAIILEIGPSPEAKRHAIEALARISKRAPQIANQPDPFVAETASWLLGENSVLPGQFGVRRAALEKLANTWTRFPDTRNKAVGASSLIYELAANDDPWLEHALIYALIALDAEDQLLKFKDSPDPRVRKAVWIILDQTQSAQLQANEVLADLDSDHAGLRSTAWWIVSRHPEWGPDLAKHFRQKLDQKLSQEQANRLTDAFGSMAKSNAIQVLIAEMLAGSEASQSLALQAMRKANLPRCPDSWLVGLAKIVDSQAPISHKLDAATTLRSLRVPQSFPDGMVRQLQELGQSPQLDPEAKLRFLDTIPEGKLRLNADLLGELQSRLKADQPATERRLAAQIIARAKLDSPQLLQLTESFKTCGAMEIEPLLEAFAKSRDDQVGAVLLEALQTPNLKSILRADQVKTRLAKFGPELQKPAEALCRALDVDRDKQQAKLETLLGQIPGGDITRGRGVFNHTKNACMQCHTIGYAGGKIGPDLTRIGSIRTDRDLLEAIIFPSASLVRGYESIVVTTHAGKTFNGLLKIDRPEELTLTTGPDQVVRIARLDIESIQPSAISIMPAGLDQQLTTRDLADLIAFLRACR